MLFFHQRKFGYVETSTKRSMTFKISDCTLLLLPAIVAMALEGLEGLETLETSTQSSLLHGTLPFFFF